MSIIDRWQAGRRESQRKSLKTEELAMNAIAISAESYFLRGLRGLQDMEQQAQLNGLEIGKVVQKAVAIVRQGSGPSHVSPEAAAAAFNFRKRELAFSKQNFLKQKGGQNKVFDLLAQELDKMVKEHRLSREHVLIAYGVMTDPNPLY